VGEYVRLRKASAYRYTGLCPFHSEKTPSFSVNASKQFYYCFGCHATGDALKFVMEIEGVSFYEALKSLAERYGIPMPKRSLYSDEESRKRAALLEMHEAAQASFQGNLRGPSGETARQYLAHRGVRPETMEEFGLGYAERSGRELVRLFEQRGVPADLAEASGLIGRRQDGSLYDKFRNRLMFPIHNERGQIIAYGGRTLSPEDEPKYLNSPETPIYKKSHVLYNLHRAKDAIRKEDRSILVEGYMDVIGVSAAGFGAVVASCGTALTTAQIQALKRHSQRIVVNFDPDAAGVKAAERSIDLLLTEGMFVSILQLDGGLDPDEYCKERGAEAYAASLKRANSYFHWLADRARAQYDMRTPEGTIAVLQTLVRAIQPISDRVERMAVAENLASYIGVERGVVLDSFRKTVAGKQAQAMERPKPIARADEKGLIYVLLSGEAGNQDLFGELEVVEILERISTRRIFQAIRAVHASGADVTFDAVNARLEESDRQLLAQILLSEETEGQELTAEYGRRCLESLHRSEEQLRRAELKAQVKQAERSGDVIEALRLAEELQRIERRSAAQM
jgi:DNA primase